ncbi:7923_t:CDS:2 [Dentiscutata erythropus]|uniref:7923_t:CDS:1 n=1 Tax=Dentiscutata erythropus TaxID=1348616 RepID=A0A9N8VFX6_9GLOM|nr:7923_t:CDS:2 [Dentiscutata erythropus]
MHEIDPISFICPSNYPYALQIIETACKVRAIPANANIQDKTISAVSKEVLKTKLDISFQIEGTEANDIEFETVLDKVLKT